MSKLHFLIHLFGSTIVVVFNVVFNFVSAADDYSFDLNEFEKKPYEFNGYLELKYEHFKFNTNSAYYFLNQINTNGLNRSAGSLLLNGLYRRDNLKLSYTGYVESWREPNLSDTTTENYESYLSYQLPPKLTLELGKRAIKWGKGYAWNPVAFIEREKDPDDPNLSREGYILALADIIYSFHGSLQTFAITPVILPVTSDTNQDYAQESSTNVAVKLYLLYKDNDIDFIYQADGSFGERFGFDFSRNITSNFEFHTEWAYITDFEKISVLDNGALKSEIINIQRVLFGLRYLTENDITYIFEYYHNGAGYDKDEVDNFFTLVADAERLINDTGDTSLLIQAKKSAKSGYSSRNFMRNYLYLRISQKEPLDILYFTPAVTVIANLDDESYSLMPEAVYTSWSNSEVRVKLTYLHGGAGTEFGEKLNSEKFEVRFQYYF